MAADGEPAHAGARPALASRRVRLWPGGPGAAPRLRAVLAEPSVSRWWGEPDPVAVIEEDLRGGGLIGRFGVEVDGQIAGGAWPRSPARS
jgi:hypothetical protein